MTQDDGTNRLLKTIIATMAVMVVGLMIVPSITRWNNRQLSHRLLDKIKNADDRSVKVPLRQLDSLGNVAIEPLMAAAASRREAVASIARQILEERLAILLTASQSAADDRLDSSGIDAIEALAVSLATHIHDFGPAGKQWAEGIAMSMIELSDKLPARQTHILLENCSNVLSAVPARGTNIRSLARGGEQRPAQPLPQFDSAIPQLEPLTRVSEKSLEHLARIQPRNTEPFANAQALPQATSTLIVEPNGAELDWQSQPKSTPPTQSLEPQPLTDASSQPTAPPPVASPQPRQARSGVVDIPDPQTMAAQAETLRAASTEELFMRLRKAKFYTAGVIRSVLAERGLVDAEIDLRLQLESPSASDRLRFMDDVSSLPTNSARRTFLWLLNDDSGDVRLRALTALATTRHPEVTAIARELAVSDNDPRVANLASQLIR